VEGTKRLNAAVGITVVAKGDGHEKYTNATVAAQAAKLHAHVHVHPGEEDEDEDEEGDEGEALTGADGNARQDTNRAGSNATKQGCRQHRPSNSGPHTTGTAANTPVSLKTPAATAIPAMHRCIAECTTEAAPVDTTRGFAQ
jgi:hypothetical protein